MKLSIITINYNNKEGLYRTLESIRLQTCKDFEYIVIDGGSTDGSVELIKEYDQYIDYWVSEPDKGIYNAMNKGVTVAHGEYCQFLNSGDWLHSTDTLNNIIPFLSLNYDIVCGNTIESYADGRRETIKVKNIAKISLLHLLMWSLPHQSTFTKTYLLKEMPFSEEYKIISDWKFFVDIHLQNDISSLIIDIDIVNFDKNGISSNNLESIIIDRSRLQNTYIHPKIKEYLFLTPLPIVYAFERIPNAYTLTRFLIWLTNVIITIYSLIKPKAVRKQQNIGTYKFLQQQFGPQYKKKPKRIIEFDL